MIICPQCGGPLAVDKTIDYVGKEMSCERCQWAGEAKEGLFVDETQAKIPEYQAEIERLYKALAQHVAPTVGKLLIETGLVRGPDGKDKQVDAMRIQFLAKVLEGSTRGTIEGIAKVLKEEAGYVRN